MNERELKELYDNICRILTDYEQDGEYEIKEWYNYMVMAVNHIEEELY